jgi:hypothetical protein
MVPDENRPPDLQPAVISRVGRVYTLYQLSRPSVEQTAENGWFSQMAWIVPPTRRASAPGVPAVRWVAKTRCRVSLGVAFAVGSERGRT